MDILDCHLSWSLDDGCYVLKYIMKKPGEAFFEYKFLPYCPETSMPVIDPIENLLCVSFAYILHIEEVCIINESYIVFYQHIVRLIL